MLGTEDASTLRIAMMGTRGVPARYGGFETAVEEIGWRLAERGHEVTVYCRRPGGDDPLPSTYRGMNLVTLPAVRSKSLETLSHTGLSVAHDLLFGRDQVVFLFNAANAPYVPLLHLRGRSVAVHVDGLEWRRSKWTGTGERYYRIVESMAVRWADALIADAAGIARYYREEFASSTVPISYGAPILEAARSDRLGELGLEPDRFHLVVARFEPENNLELIVRGFHRSARLPLVLVGGAPYSDAYTASLHAEAAHDDRIVFLGPVWDQEQLDQLYANGLTYLHGHSVGGTNPSLLRAMGAATPVLAYDVTFNREVLGEQGCFFGSERELAGAIEAAEADPAAQLERGRRLQDRARTEYRWDDVARRYEDLARWLARGHSRRGEATGQRLRAAGWARSPRGTSGTGRR